MGTPPCHISVNDTDLQKITKTKVVELQKLKSIFLSDFY